MSSDNSPPKGGRPPMNPLRKWALLIYIVVVVVLVKLYWPGWPYPDKPAPPPAAPVSGTQVPQN
jgi:hypothetical protein